MAVPCVCLDPGSFTDPPHGIRHARSCIALGDSGMT
jgi:hypothetical protein